MIAACPKCQTRYRVEPERLGPEGARLRCSQCSAVFRVRLPAQQAAPSDQVARSEPEVSEAHEAALPQSNQPLSADGRSLPENLAPQSQGNRSEPRNADSSHSDAPQFDHTRLVLIAHPDPDACKRIAEMLEREGIQVLVAHDGVEAILSIQRALPRAVVLDAALPKMFGFQVCELIKRNASLRVTHVCLMGAIHRDDRYRRAPSETYGADFYVEGAKLSVALLDWLASIGFDLSSRRDSQAPDLNLERPPEVLRAPTPSEAQEARPRDAAGVAQRVSGKGRGDPVPAAGGGPIARSSEPAARESQPGTLGRIGVDANPFAAERAQAERLARIIVSDIVLYNEAKFSAAVRSGGVLEAMREELKEGRTLFRERIDVQVRDERDFLADELVRVARARGMS